jgi:CDP-glucose 4,6-dehydratase
MHQMFWKDKKVLITGHTGFKGSWLSLWLQMLGAKVVGFSLEPLTQPNLFSLANVECGMTSIIGDIRDLESLTSVFKTHQPEIVFHLAAQPLVRRSYDNPVETYSTNVMGLVHLLECIRNTSSVRAVVNVTTDKCYENKEWLWGYRETDRLGGHDPYSNSKACAELVTAAFHSSYFNKNQTKIATARAGNVIGGGDWAQNRLVPDVINACINRSPVILRHPASIRPWQHVLEPLHGYLLLAERLYLDQDLYAGGWNFGPNQEDAKPVSWVVEFILETWGGCHRWEQEQGEQPHEAQLLKLDCSKAKSLLQWHPVWNLENGLKKTVDWYLAYVANVNLRDVTMGQIDDYMIQVNT